MLSTLSAGLGEDLSNAASNLTLLTTPTFEQAVAYLRLEERRLKHLRARAAHTAFVAGFSHGASSAKLSASDGSLASSPGDVAVQQVCLHMHAPRDADWAAVKRILRYVYGTMGYGLSLHASPSTLTDLVAYSDADWAGCPDTRRSTGGYCVYLGSSLVSWSSKRQPTVSRSSAEAEYHAVAECTWLRQLLSELSCPVDKATVVFCDNVSAVYLSANPVHHRRTKHIELDIHFVRLRGRGWHTTSSHVRLLASLGPAVGGARILLNVDWEGTIPVQSTSPLRSPPPHALATAAMAPKRAFAPGANNDEASSSRSVLLRR
ncbi:hypothetical protein QYE76_054107 [Lolium multiflorum]|uniref:Uncharacterized protein n=1 Tax=Lolium multiflorum TaxID=4521 RepID=A0AAD8WML6_LOLMU|nr:hypothetical protein QYE76_054107 [Lolium multiflorum]